MKILFLCLIPLWGMSQRSIEGKVKNALDGKPVSFATIALVRENKGINADENGQFKLEVLSSSKDSLRISSVGYKTLVLPLSITQGTLTINLEAVAVTLSEVVIATKKNEEVLNKLGNCKSNYYVSTGAITQIAQRFRASNEFSILKSVSICKLASSSLFRLRIYTMDSTTGQPGEDVVQQLIEINSSTKFITIDLLKYKIILPNKDFFIAIEWLYLSQNEFRNKIKINGRKISYSNFYPGISMKETSSYNSSLENDLWFMKFDGKWRKNESLKPNTNFMISAELAF